jgi:hypothetical protein
MDDFDDFDDFDDLSDFFEPRLAFLLLSPCCSISFLGIIIAQK